MKKSASWALSAACLFGCLFGSLAYAQDGSSRYTFTKKAPASTTHVTGYAGSGLGNFQDIQIPINDITDTRGDGTVIQEENTDHLGLPLYAGIGVVHYGKSTVVDFGLGFIQMRAISGPAATQSSSYGRTELGAGGKYLLPLGSSTLGAGMRLMARRSTYNNVSNGHFVEAAIARGTLQLAFSSWSMEAWYGMAPVARFGYNEGSIFGGEAFKKSSVELAEAGFMSSFTLREHVWLDFGVEQEMVRATIGDIMEYNGFGLGVTPALNNSRTYDLATTVMKLGVRKDF